MEQSDILGLGKHVTEHGLTSKHTEVQNRGRAIAPVDEGAHEGGVVVQHRRDEVEREVERGRLLTQRCRAVLGGREVRHLCRQAVETNFAKT